MKIFLIFTFFATCQSKKRVKRDMIGQNRLNNSLSSHQFFHPLKSSTRKLRKESNTMLVSVVLFECKNNSIWTAKKIKALKKLYRRHLTNSKDHLKKEFMIREIFQTSTNESFLKVGKNVKNFKNLSSLKL